MKFYEDAVSARIVSMTRSFITNPETNIELSAEEYLIYVARVSNPKNQNDVMTTKKLIKYLLDHKHFSPFEMVNVTFEINTTRDIGRQMLRHKSNQFQEFSQRYADPLAELEFVLREARLQDKKNRQNSIEVDDKELSLEWMRRQRAQIELAMENYRWALDNGIAKEQARCVLPEGNTMTRMYMNTNLRSVIHYLDARTDESTQKEHRLIARKIKEALTEHFSFLQ